jgi:hypothetical protein
VTDVLVKFEGHCKGQPFNFGIEPLVYLGQTFGGTTSITGIDSNYIEGTILLNAAAISASCRANDANLLDLFVFNVTKFTIVDDSTKTADIVMMFLDYK